MTTSELIDLLKALDPEGTTTVVVGNCPVYTADRVPAYYDGKMWELILDPSQAPYYNITGIRRKQSGMKVRLDLSDLESVLWMDPNATVDLSDLEHSSERENLANRVAEIRREVFLSSPQKDGPKGALTVFPEDPNLKEE
jgi:hypothetical protein